MNQYEYNKHFSVFFKALRNALDKHHQAFSFRISEACLNSLRSTLEMIERHEGDFKAFAEAKQKKIDTMEPGIIKEKMQAHLDYVVVNTYAHFRKLVDKYYWFLEGVNKERGGFEFSLN